MLSTATAGLLTGLSLIVAIGAQNAHVLRQGLRRRHVVPVVLLCTVSDVVLIVAGVAGVGAVVERAPLALDVVRWLGVGFLAWYGVSSLLRARRPGALDASGEGDGSLRTALGRAAALTWLNPHVYLDTVVLLGSVAQHQPSPWWFAAGACVASVVWFAALGGAARVAARWLSGPRTWQVLEVAVGVTMLAIAVRLAVG